ncbi:MAG: indole-3-glycerol-phosphate synthase [Nitrospirae bacterium]|nr:indole-3-glycerol-phosphate synthase [Nitrospirota bacterium]
MASLADVLAHTRQGVEQRKRARPSEVVLEGPAQDHEKISFVDVARPRGDAAGSTRDRNVVIAEFKRASLTRTFVQPDEDPAPYFEAYREGGAAAISVLTEPEFFHGDPADIETAKRTVDVPVLMKDFVIDEYQIYEGLAAGADFVLLIVRILTDEQIDRMLHVVRRHGIEALVEVCSEEDLRRALRFEVDLLGVNSRDLDTLRVDTTVFETLADRLPAKAVRVAESGIKSREQIARLRGLGYDAFLVGEALMSHPQPSEALRELVEIA